MPRVDPMIRRAYVRQLAKVIAADGRIDADELVKLYEICGLLGVPEGERLELITTLAFEPEALVDEQIPDAVLSDDELRMALAKDAVFFDHDRNNAETRIAVKQIVDAIKLTPEQARVIADWVSMENAILRKMGAGEEWMSSVNPREISARGAAVGVPLTALYFAGTTGFGAVGLTSGLAAIGSYTGLTVLGLNPMTAGIAGLIMAGIAVKKIADYALGRKDTTAEALRQRISTIRDVHVKAATAIAGDIPRFEQTATRDPVRAATVLAEMRIALRQVEMLGE